MKKISLFLAILIVFGSCSQKFSLQKRRYTKGFYFAAHKHVKNSPETAVVQDKHRTTQAKALTVPVETSIVDPQNESSPVDLKVETKAQLTQVQLPTKSKQTLPKIISKREGMAESPKTTSFLRNGIKEQIGKRSGGDVLSTILIGYIVIGLIVLIISGIATIGLAETLLTILGIVVVCIILYAIGKVFKNLLGV